MRGMLLPAACLLALACAGPRVRPPGEPPEPRPQPDAASAPRVLELIVRAPDELERPTAGPALRRAADTAVQWLTGSEFPLDGWAMLARDSSGTLPSSGGPLEKVAAERLLQTDASGARHVTIWRPEWRNGALMPSPPEGPLLVDLLSPGIDGERWKAGLLLAAEDASAAAAVAEFTLAAHALGRAPDLAEIARRWGVDPEALAWKRVVVD